MKCVYATSYWGQSNKTKLMFCEGSNLPLPSLHVSMLRLLTQIVPGDLYIVDLWLNASDECTLAQNRYETLPSCKGQPPRQILGRIPPHTHLQVCPSYVKPPHSREDAQWRAWHTHTTRTALSVHACPHWYQNNWLALYRFHILKRMSGQANQLAVHVLVFTSS